MKRPCRLQANLICVVEYSNFYALRYSVFKAIRNVFVLLRYEQCSASAAGMTREFFPATDNPCVLAVGLSITITTFGE